MNEACPISLEPGDYERIAQSKRAAGDELAYLAHLIAARTLEEYRRNAAALNVRPLQDVATGYFMKGDLETAERWYALLTAIAADNAEAWLNLAAIHARRNEPAQAQRCRARAFTLQRLFVEEAASPGLRALILYAGAGAGNVPCEILFSSPQCSRLKYAIDIAASSEDDALPAYDLVFNAIGDADAIDPLLERLQAFCRHVRVPVLNPPPAVAQTRRQGLARLLAGVAGCVVPPCMRWEGGSTEEADIRELLERENLRLPALIRETQTHGGETLVRCASVPELGAEMRRKNPAYVTAFVDSKGADGHYRKYRVCFIGGEPFPYHLAISTHWMVHYHSAEMAAAPWKIDEERRFLDDPEAALGGAAWRTLCAIGKRLGLDYAGIDFTLLADGRLLVFEANATMLIHYENQSGVLSHKNPHVRRIVAAFEALLTARTRCSL